MKPKWRSSLGVAVFVAVGLAWIIGAGWLRGTRPPRQGTALPQVSPDRIEARQLEATSGGSESLSIPESVVRERGEPQREVEDGSAGELVRPWRLIVRNRLSEQRVTRGIELDFLNDRREPETLRVNSLEEFEAMPPRLREKTVTLHVDGYQEAEFSVHSWQGLQVVRLFPERTLHLRFRGAPVAETGLQAVVQLGGRTRELGEVNAGTEFEISLKRERRVRLSLYPDVQLAAVRPVDEVEFALDLAGDTDREFDLQSLHYGSNRDLRLQLRWPEGDPDATRFVSSLAESSASGRPLAGLLSRRILRDAWEGEAPGERERLFQNLPTGTYTFAIDSIGFEHTFLLWPEDERGVEHVEQVVLPRLSQVTIVPANLERESEAAKRLQRGELWWGALGREGSADLLHKLRKSRSRAKTLRAARKVGLAARAQDEGDGVWKITTVPSRTLWIVYESPVKWSAEPLLLNPASGSSEAALEIVTKPL